MIKMSSTQPRMQIFHRDGKITNVRGRRDRRAELERFAHLLDNNSSAIITGVPALKPEVEEILRILPREVSAEASALYNSNEKMKRVRVPSSGNVFKFMILGPLVPLLVLISFPNINKLYVLTGCMIISGAIIKGIRNKIDDFRKNLVNVAPALNQAFTSKGMMNCVQPRTIDVTPKTKD
ncbi:MAG: hypothetical protein Q7S22_03885 [Candidatus Micrarchaeota archaeon]|nr:hypothetical protein [Candidatus Micrarchaeota archaeon]